MKKYAISAVILVFVIIFAALVVRRIRGQRVVARRGGMTAVAVEIEPVRRQTLYREGRFTGSLLPRTQFVVAPKVSGRLEKLLVDMGDRIESGQLVAVLDSEEYALQVAQSQAEVDVARSVLLDAESSLTVANNDLRRMTDLHQQEVASDAQLDEVQARQLAAEARVQVARAQIRQREAALKSAETRLGYTRLHAVWNSRGGARMVAARFADEGTMLRANDPVVSIVETESLLAVIHVIERDYPEVVQGQPVVVRTDARPGEDFEGQVARVAPAIDEHSRHARVEIEIPNPEGLLAPGMFIRAAIRFEERPEALTVPAAAVSRRNGRQGVFVADKETMTGRFVEIVPGIASGGMQEVIEPELDGYVITLGQHLLEDGAAITLPGSGRADGGTSRGGAE